MVYIHNGILAVRKIMPFEAAGMGLELLILSEVSQRQISYDITYIWNLKCCSAYLQNRNRLADIENKLLLTQVERKHGGDKLEVWD